MFPVGFRCIFAHPISNSGFFLVATFLIYLLLNPVAYANGVDTDGFLQEFESQRGKVSSYEARFVQKKTIALFDEEKISTGSVIYKAPRMMIWKYETPDRTQMRIDSKTVSFYFPELEQIEVYSLEASTGASYFFFAFEATGAELKEHFDVMVGAADEDFNRVSLTPKANKEIAGLQEITLWLGKNDFLPRKIIIHERSGDTTEVKLADISLNEPVPDEELEFDAPPGTEIIEAGKNGL